MTDTVWLIFCLVTVFCYFSLVNSAKAVMLYSLVISLLVSAMIIPLQQLEPQTLENVIENFVLREGTDYGAHEVSLAQKIAEVHRQLQSGEAVLVWSELHETVNIMPAALFDE